MAVTVTPLPDDEDEVVETPITDSDKDDEKPDEKPAEVKPAADEEKPDEKPADETPDEDDEDEDVPLGEPGVRALNAEREKVRTIRRENAQLRKDLADTKSTVVKAFARAAFAQAELLIPEGKETRAINRALKLLDLDKVTVTADGEATGLAEQIAELREDMPELFVRKRTGRRVVDAADRGGDPTPKSSAQKLLEQRNAS